jgi:serine/threonine protein kinase
MFLKMQEKSFSLPNLLALRGYECSDDDSTPRFLPCPQSYDVGPEDETPKKRKCLAPPSLRIQDFLEVLAGEHDLDLLLSFRSAIDARCEEIQIGAQHGTQAENAAMTKQRLAIEFVDDGDKMPRNLGKLADWTIGPELGQGRFGTVFKAKNHSTNCAEAVKVILKSTLSDEADWSSTSQEYEMLRKLSPHPHTICLTGALQSESSIYFFLSIANGKELFDYIKLRQQNKKPVTAEAISGISESISSALAHCHQHGVCHRDLKPENVIVDQQTYMAKLVDFGSACPRHALCGQCIGTMPFIAPECLREIARDGAPADVWSLAVVILEMRFGLRALSRFLGWDDKQPSQQECGHQLQKVFADPAEGLSKMQSTFETCIAAPTHELLASMLDADPTKRPEAQAIQNGSKA